MNGVVLGIFIIGFCGLACALIDLFEVEIANWLIRRRRRKSQALPERRVVDWRRDGLL